MFETIGTICDTDNHVQIYITRIETGFSVTIQDMDARQFLPTCQIFPNEEQAWQYARKCISPK